MLLTVHIYNAWSGPKMEGTLAVLHPAKEKPRLKVMPIISTAVSLARAATCPFWPQRSQTPNPTICPEVKIAGMLGEHHH